MKPSLLNVFMKKLTRALIKNEVRAAHSDNRFRSAGFGCALAHLHDSHTLSRNSAIDNIIHNIGVAARVVLGGMPIEEGSLHRPKPLDAQSSTQGRTREAHVLTSGSQDS